ncbi:MAG: zf-HC2 domain-containing protein [Candidatus Omnitrophica bacterium]|nr:zf-HC2 domain-containing protein [Candidatus Omnitrophota bacterium]
MTDLKQDVRAHPKESELADYLSNALNGEQRKRVEDHVACCKDCLDNAVSAYESVKIFKKRKNGIMKKKINVYLILAVISFMLSFVFQRFFLQFLTATLLLGVKWITDAKSTKMLIMIYEAWKKGGEKEASRILSVLDREPKNRL